MNTEKRDLDPQGCLDRQNVWQLIVTCEGQDLSDGLLRDTKLATYIARMVVHAVAQLVEALR
jgi:hypothetical protein